MNPCLTSNHFLTFQEVFSRYLAAREEKDKATVVVEQSLPAQVWTFPSPTDLNFRIFALIAFLLFQILGGFVAGAITVAVTNPLDVVKTVWRPHSTLTTVNGSLI